MDVEQILEGPNDAEREAAIATKGPVAILAGAGTGKTSAITARIACQVATGAFAPNQILAVTFTDKAAGEPKRRITTFGVDEVEARTFHSAALSQLAAPLGTPHRRAAARRARPQGAADLLACQRAAGATQVPAPARAGGRDRLGQETG